MKQKPERYLLRWILIWIVLIITFSSAAGYLVVLCLTIDNVIYVEKVILSYITNDTLYVCIYFWMNALLFAGGMFFIALAVFKILLHICSHILSDKYWVRSL